MSATPLTDDERRAAHVLICKGARYLWIDRRFGEVEAMPRDEAVAIAERALKRPLDGTWRELTEPAKTIKPHFDAWALVVDLDGYRITLVGVGRHAPQPAN